LLGILILIGTPAIVAIVVSVFHVIVVLSLTTFEESAILIQFPQVEASVAILLNKPKL